jgi:uncharacterized protein YigA (DUF484 family)
MPSTGQNNPRILRRPRYTAKKNTWRAAMTTEVADTTGIAVRDKILAKPEVVLEDPELMKALIAANDRTLGGNIVDLRGIAMERLEARLNRLEDTHRSVIAAAYENLSGTNQIHRAILAMMDPMEFTPFLKSLGGEVAEILRVDRLRLMLETEDDQTDPSLEPVEGVLLPVEPGSIDAYITEARNMPVRKVTLRQVSSVREDVYGPKSDFIRSEALLKLDFGSGRLPGLLVFGSEDPHQFRPNQGTELLTFFASVFERQMRHWLN